MLDCFRSTALSNEAVIASENRRRDRAETKGRLPPLGDPPDDGEPLVGEERSSGLIDPIGLNGGLIGSGEGMSC